MLQHRGELCAGILAHWEPEAIGDNPCKAPGERAMRWGKIMASHQLHKHPPLFRKEVAIARRSGEAAGVCFPNCNLGAKQWMSRAGAARGDAQGKAQEGTGEGMAQSIGDGCDLFGLVVLMGMGSPVFLGTQQPRVLQVYLWWQGELVPKQRSSQPETLPFGSDLPSFFNIRGKKEHPQHSTVQKEFPDLLFQSPRSGNVITLLQLHQHNNNNNNTT